MTNFEEHFNEQMKDPEFRAEYEAVIREEKIAEALVMARRRKGLSQKELSDLTGIPQARISKIERGNGNPSVRTLHRLASGMDMKMHLIFMPAGE
jgi:transcriptional regulator with XRE-family HTH domain